MERRESAWKVNDFATPLLLVFLLLTLGSGKIYNRTKADATPANHQQAGCPPIFDDSEKLRLDGFITRDTRPKRPTREAICIEIGSACSARTVGNVMASMGYHKRIPRRKFNIRPADKLLRVAWCQERLHWTYEEWIRVLYTYEPSFSQLDLFTDNGLYASYMRSTMLIE